ncbi:MULTISPECIES: ABC transporter substrate-binding protein [unclassified Beijerinckia]|uniref:ABC transporter substrate-binding protein n=1 Tax=unclassified Beijerinckia TaxID=2638183 RepID=UPI00089562E8|nr:MULTISPECIES: ABC transporter substrate-binding protein [unclassified Beijerinckia]MDH7798931.1 ABC-type nitrate/sulfonate/bicarbonate transport system substrate-binding protein [Beijerinckia sp. GAS462]SED86654.1 ABC-type nitrate/sulfonate/bicarbonate transport system, substrate-binding protein [Beijerinckia sp. 28-YEA-48]
MKLRIDNHPDPMMGLLPLFCAIDFGLFRKRGIDPVFVDRTNVQAIEDMRAGQMDISFSGPTLTIMARERFGLDTKFVSAAALRGSMNGHTADFMNIVARDGIQIEKPQDFENKTLAAFALDGGITHSAPLYLFNNHGVDTNKIAWKTMPFHKMPDALAAGEVDVAICVEPFITIMRRRGLGREVDEVFGAGSLAMAATGNPSLVSNWWTTKKTYAENPELFIATNDILNEAIAAIYDDPSAALDAMARQTGQQIGILREIGFQTTLFHAFPLNAPDVQNMYAGWVRVLHGAGLLEKPIDCSGFFDA